MFGIECVFRTRMLKSSFNTLVVIFVMTYFYSDDVFAMSNQHEQVLIPANAKWFYQAGNKLPDKGWRQVSFDDSHWKRGRAGFGYGDGDDRTRLQSMRGEYDSLRIRHSFTVNNLDEINHLYLYVRFDDAFIAYLNGVEIAHSGIIFQQSDYVVENHEAKGYAVFKLESTSVLLTKGKNVLVLEGFNRSRDSSDFSLEPVLTSFEVKNPGLLINLSKAEQLADLNFLQEKLEDQSSYLLLNKFDYFNEIKLLKKNIEEESNGIVFARKIDKYIARIGDAHARVKVELDDTRENYLPFVMADSSIGVLALTADQSAFLDSAYPILDSIDGLPLTQWLESAAKYISQASPQLIRYRSLRELRSIDRIRNDLGKERSQILELTLTSTDGEKHKKLTLATSRDRIPSGKVRFNDSGILPENLAYLRIRSMYKEPDEVLNSMASFKNTDGLIIDVRENRGGYYDILRALYGYFVAEDSPPYVANIAAYRLSSLFDDDFLEYRSSYRLSYSGWTKSEKTAIEKAMATFKPQWKIPENKFSDWHFMVLGRSEQNGQYYYSKPVVVLCDSASFSATDGFLSAFSDLPQVTLIGQASSGGSGASQTIRLLNSGIDIAISSMVSFRPNGRLYDGNGVEVDVSIMPDPTDYFGETDAVLDKAIHLIEQKIGNKKKDDFNIQ